MRGPELFVFGTACSQRIWHAPPITSRSPDAGREIARLAATFRTDQERAARAQRHDRDARVGELAELAVGVPRDAVVAVAVVVARGTGESHAELGIELRADGVERRMRQPVVASSTSARGAGRRPCGRTCGAGPASSRRVRSRQSSKASAPSSQLARYVDPRRVVELDAIEARAFVDLRLATSEQRPLPRGHAGEGSEHVFVCPGRRAQSGSGGARVLGPTYLSSHRFTDRGVAPGRDDPVERARRVHPGGRTERPCRRACPSCAGGRRGDGRAGNRAAPAGAPHGPRPRSGSCAAPATAAASFGPVFGSATAAR